jgi:hypothetical protein
MAASSDSKEEPAKCSSSLTEASQYPLASDQYIPKNVGALCCQQRSCRLIDTRIVGHHLNYTVGLDHGVVLDSCCYGGLNCRIG